MELHETILGRRLIESTMPRIADALERIAASLELIVVPTPIELGTTAGDVEITACCGSRTCADKSEVKA